MCFPVNTVIGIYLGDPTNFQVPYGPIDNMEGWIRETCLEKLQVWHRNPCVRENIESITLATSSIRNQQGWLNARLTHTQKPIAKISLTSISEYRSCQFWLVLKKNSNQKWGTYWIFKMAQFHHFPPQDYGVELSRGDRRRRAESTNQNHQRRTHRDQKGAQSLVRVVD